jgi:pyruvate-formate lyase-activating enzyme
VRAEASLFLAANANYSLILLQHCFQKLTTAALTQLLKRRAMYLSASARRSCHTWDFVYHDIKFIDPLRHKKWTGVDNTRILDNLKRAYTTWPEKKFIARTPLIPGVNGGYPGGAGLYPTA